MPVGVEEHDLQRYLLGKFDNWGLQVWEDDFEDATLTPSLVASGTGAAIARDATEAYRGLACLSITTGAAASAVAYAELNPIMPYEKKFVMELAFKYETTDVTVPAYIYFDIQWYDGTTRHDAFIRYNRASDLWEYSTDGGTTWANIDGTYHKFDASKWQKLVFGVDFVEDAYLGLIVGGVLLTLDTQTLFTVANATFRSLRARVGVQKIAGSTGTTAVLYVDDWVIREV